ncbi:MAG: phosphoribosylformimino-5-aminoimidazole carboxamide ribotide isomerase [Oscillospiraceae bacterium]|jgi:phosphoribosylformimino-5-aminoimidazole carboxamide ribotide isomerase|nr:phosphoribosylformimino-5-aminoimidazole carboxamide ribotide isomerase [Oscillospiraceae bacterium]
MKFRPCIDIHDGRVKQLVGGTLADKTAGAATAVENFVSDKSAADFARMYQKDGLRGGHVIALNAAGNPHYEASMQQALDALAVYPGGLQFGGGVNAENAAGYLDAGASHVIVTSFVFQKGEIHYENLRSLVRVVGKNRLVLDLSCRRRGDVYFIVTDRWQTFTDVAVNANTLTELAAYCDEFLVHAVDAEGRQAGIDERLAGILGAWGKLPVTYAGGVGSYIDLEKLDAAGHGRLDVTVGSALDIFGGRLSYEKIVLKYQ